MTQRTTAQVHEANNAVIAAAKAAAVAHCVDMVIAVCGMGGDVRRERWDGDGDGDE